MLARLRSWALRLLVALRLRSGCCLAHTYRPVGWGNRGYCCQCDGRLW